MESHYLWLLQVNMVGSYKMDKQIEELANDLQEAWTAWSLSADLPKPWTFVAEILAKKWQPKVPECVVDYIENYKEGFKEGVVALKTQLEGIITQPVEMSYFKKPSKRGKVDKELLLGMLDEICRELVDE
jgi:hypothetical protein